MATSPVTLDLSKAQPINGGITLDLSKAQPLSPSHGAGGTWEPEESPIVRFGRGALNAVNGVLQSGAFGVSNEAPPTDAQGKAIPPSIQSIKDELVNFVKGFAAQKEVDEGDYAGAAGKILTNLAMLKAAHEATTEPTAPKGSLDMGPAPGVNVPGVSPTGAKVAARVGGAVAGSAVGSAMGHPFLGMIAGEQLGGALAPKLTWQGFNVGGQGAPGFQPPEGISINGPMRAENVGPQPTQAPQPAPVDTGALQEAQAEMQRRIAARKAPSPVVDQTPAVQPSTISQADQVSAARNLGFKGKDPVAAAKAKFGEEGWQRVIAEPAPIQNVAQAQQAISDVVDQVAPNAPKNAKIAIDFQLQKGDVNAAQSMLDDIREDKALQQENQADLEKQNASMFTYKQRMNRAASSGDANKGSLLTAEQVVNAMPAPYGTMEANKLLGYEGRRTVPEATQARTEAMQPKFDMNAPWGGAAKPYAEAVQEFLQKNRRPQP